MNRSYVALMLLSFACTSFAGRTVTDGFQSRLVRPSPDRPTPDPDPCFRFFDVYLPDEFDAHPEMTFPIVYHLTGLGGNYSSYSMSDRLVMDQMLARNEIVSMIIVAPDPRVLNYDGSFWTDSHVVQDPTESFNNKFERYIVEELIPYVNTKYRQKTTPEGDAAPFRAIMGQSMGGYGSLFFGIKYPELFSAYAGDSPTAFWVINTNLASPPEAGFPGGNPMYSFNKLLIPGLARTNPPGMLTPNNDDTTFGFYAWAGAFSPVVQGIGPDNCTFDTNTCLTSAPFCVTYPFVVGAQNMPQIVNGSLVANQAILNVWEHYDPYALLDEVDQEVLKRKAIYVDSGADLVLEPVDNVGSHYFSEKLASLDVNNEYLLFQGGHTTCTTIKELPCYRFTTNLKLFSGKFAEAGKEPKKTIFTGIMTIELTGKSVMTIKDKELVCIETAHESGVTATEVTMALKDEARLEIGTNDTLGGGLQVGNRYGKANLLFDPTRVNDSIRFTLDINGPKVTVQIGKQGYLGFGIGVNGNATDVANYWGLSSLANVATVQLNFKQGRFEHNQIASSLQERGSLFALGLSNTYTLTLDPSFVIAGGANLATMTEANLIHPTVQDTAGSINPGGIRNRIVAQPATEFDDFYGPPKGLYASKTFSRNVMSVGILSSSLMLFDRNKQPIQSSEGVDHVVELPLNATQEQLFNFLSVANYFEQGRKRAPINQLDDTIVVGYITPKKVTADGQSTTELGINRYEVNKKDLCNPLSTPFPLEKILVEGAVGIALATINGEEQVVRLFDLNPSV